MISESGNSKDLAEWVQEKLSHLDSKYTYHDRRHTRQVLRNANEIMAHDLLSPEEENLVRAAALLHDLAFINSHEKHEEKSAEIAAEELPRFGFSEKDIELIQGMILATRIPQNPKNHLEKILCDADLFYLGTGRYFEFAKNLETEWKNIGIWKSEKDWLKTQLSFLNQHNYHTEYAQTHLKPGKQLIIDELEGLESAAA